MKQNIKFYDIPNSIKQLEFDGDKTDLRLHCRENFRWGAKSKKAYTKAQKEIDAIDYKGNGWILYAWYDVSSYEYWMKNMKETNYIQITVSFDNETVEKEEVEKINAAIVCASLVADEIETKYNYDPCPYV